MQIVIDIPKYIYEKCIRQNYYTANLARLIKNGTPLPERHGALKDVSNFDVVTLQGKSNEYVDGVKWVLEQIDNAPTILEATEGEE